jgi:hypothetical protein
MTFKELLDSLTDDTITASLHKLYYSDRPDYNFTSYLTALKAIRALAPTESNLTIVVKAVTADSNPGDFVEEFVDVDCRDDNGKVWALDFVPWNKWLGSEVDAISLVGFGKAEIAAHCLWEMTFYGYTEEKIRKVEESVMGEKDLLDKDIDDTL